MQPAGPQGRRRRRSRGTLANRSTLRARRPVHGAAPTRGRSGACTRAPRARFVQRAEPARRLLEPGKPLGLPLSAEPLRGILSERGEAGRGPRTPPLPGQQDLGWFEDADTFVEGCNHSNPVSADLKPTPQTNHVIWCRYICSPVWRSHLSRWLIRS